MPVPSGFFLRDLLHHTPWHCLDGHNSCGTSSIGCTEPPEGKGPANAKLVRRLAVSCQVPYYPYLCDRARGVGGRGKK